MPIQPVSGEIKAQPLNDNFSYLESLALNANGGPIDEVSSETELHSKYPNGANGVVLVSGIIYLWNGTAWFTNGTVYQATAIADSSISFKKVVAQNKLYSILPRNIRMWHAFKVSDSIGQGYVFNNTGKTLENSNDYFEESVVNYGLYTTLLRLPENGYKSTIYLRGTSNYRVAIVEYDENKKVIKVSQWANSIDWLISDNCRYVVFTVKRYDNQPMKLSEILTIDCGVYSEKLSELTSSFDKISEQFGEWIQGEFDYAGNGMEIGNATYSNYRMSNYVNVNPSTTYKFNCNLLSEFQYVIVLADNNNRQIISCGWVTTKEEVVLRTPPNCSRIYLTLANVDNSKLFKDSERISMKTTYTTQDQSVINQYKGPVTNQDFIVSNNWFNLSIGKGSDGKVSTPVATNRLLTRFDVNSDKIYSILTEAPENFRFNYVQVDINGFYLHDTYWQVGGCRLKNETNGYIYISVHKLDESNNVIDINISDAQNINIIVKETSAYNSLLENGFRNKLICHRGASGIEPENTLPAFERCGRLGIWGCEMDVQITNDQKFVIIHDETIDRTTTGSGKVVEMTLTEIREFDIDFGANIDSYSGLKVPTLKEAVDTCRVYGTIPVFDIGAFGLNGGDSTSVNLFLKEIETLGILQDCIILCQGTFLASSVRQKNKLTPIITQYSGNIDADIESRRLFRFENAYCGGWNLTATDEQLKELYKTGKTYQLQFYAITNDKEQAKKYLELGCDFICSDYPDILDFS